jgi:hypothetical protein
MNTYYDLAITVPAERRILAIDLAEQLDILSKQLFMFVTAMDTNPRALDDPQESKLYFATMWAFLAAQKQYEKLLPPLAGVQPADPLTEFNASNAYECAGY